MNKSIIEIHNLSKRYYLPQENHSHFLRDDLERFIRNPWKFFHSEGKEFWALKNITLSIKQGEAIGIIGPNGAGKSTLLKAIAGIITPTSGTITIRGTVGSLLDIGIGFHSELTGKENIYLSGVTLGIKKDFIDERFEDIVAFSGIGQFLHVPVKYYSTGMYIRLAFSIAIQLEPEILLVDEVLMTGDAEFQKKSFAKIQDIMKNKHRAVVLVSHHMDTIKRTCDYVYCLENGTIKHEGSPTKVVKTYLSQYN